MEATGSGINRALVTAFAMAVKARRNQLQISQEELAHRAHVNRSYIAKLELAQNQPTLSVLDRIAQGLEIGLDELIRQTMGYYRSSVSLGVGTQG
jgi:transcriptional regulator with XRE-family HTH domain